MYGEFEELRAPAYFNNNCHSLYYVLSRRFDIHIIINGQNVNNNDKHIKCILNEVLS